MNNKNARNAKAPTWFKWAYQALQAPLKIKLGVAGITLAFAAVARLAYMDAEVPQPVQPPTTSTTTTAQAAPTVQDVPRVLVAAHNKSGPGPV